MKTEKHIHGQESCHNCRACACAHGHETEAKNSWNKIIWAAVLFAAALAAPDFLWLKLPLYVASYLLCGTEVLLTSFRNIKAGEVFDENFLMALATFGAFAIGEYPEAAAVMLFYQTGERLQELAAGRSRSSIVKLMDLRPDFARVIHQGKEEKINPQDVTPGEITVVLPGERIALDGIIVEGEGHIDASALTGESRPISALKGKEVLAGCISLDGTLQIRTTKNYQNSAVAKILELAENAANKKSAAEKFITRFARIYTPAVVCVAAAVAILPPLIWEDAPFKIWFYRALIFLVISCPCALVLSVPLGFFGGIGGAAKNGILIKGGSYLERLAHIHTLAFDKTGTLTQGVFEVTGIFAANGVSEQELLRLAATAEQGSNHPIAKALLLRAALPQEQAKTPTSVREYAGEGLACQEGNTQILAGNLRLMERFHIQGAEPAEGTCVYVAENGIYKGRIELGDKPKAGAQKALQELKTLVKQTVVLSGDNPSAVQKTARELGITHAYGGLLPADKVARLEELMKNAPKGSVTAFAGDGINDAPVLARADLALAMGALGSDAAIEAADVVLMTDELNRIPAAIRIARKTLRVVKQNVVFALAVKAGVLLLGVVGLANMWAAVFADVGVSLLAVANSLRPLYFKE